jgi:3-oxoacyl-[acyl-carrier protein] reductase
MITVVHLDTMEKFLIDQTSVVTGASRDRGIGAAICRSLAAAGSNIFFTSWQPYDASMAEPEFVREFKGNGARRIVSMTFGQSTGPMPGTLSYASTKGAIEAFTLSFSAEMAPFGISVNAVDPGPTGSGWMSGETRNQLAARFPIGRLNEPDDAASVVRFLVSSEADTITGQIIRARGGFL